MSKFTDMLAAADDTVKRAEAETQATVESVYIRHAFHMLDLFRELVAEHNTSRHKIVLRTGMGTASIWIGDTLWYEREVYRRQHAPIRKTLKWIDSQLDHDWDYLIPDNSPLN